MSAEKLESFVLGQVKNLINNPIAKEKLIFDRSIKLDDDLSDDFIYNLTTREIVENLFWIINNDDPLLNMPFRNIDNPSMVSDQFLTSLIQSLKVSEKVLQKIANTNNYGERVRSFVSNNTRYFWIDISLFP